MYDWRMQKLIIDVLGVRTQVGKEVDDVGR